MSISLKLMFALAVSSFGISTVEGSIVVETVPIRHLNNPSETVNTVQMGSISYAYDIGRYEVTNDQYVAMLNSVAATDTNGLYNTQMNSFFGGIVRAGASGSYTYSSISGRGSNPVNWVSFWDATRFANWMHNGQPVGAQSAATTEDGAYTLTPAGIAANSVNRNASATWALTSEQEWYKAAYYQPASDNGDADSYWRYPTSSNALPTGADINAYNSIGNVTAVGSYDPNYYDTYDMAGNVFEWNEAALSAGNRNMRGTAYNYSGTESASNIRYYNIPAATEPDTTGFRLVSFNIPEPSTAATLAAGLLIGLRRRR